MLRKKRVMATTVSLLDSGIQRLPWERGVGLTSIFSRWENGIIPYEFHSSLSDGGRTVARQAIEHWNDKSSITLVERNATAADAPSDYVQFVKGPGCASWVGKQGQVQEIWVSDFCTTGSMIHEIGHAIGLLHEHTRADRDQYIEVLWANIQQDKTFNFELNASGSVDLGEYDYNSIMHYGDYFFSSNGEPTMRAINAGPGDTLGQRRAVSEQDLVAVNTLYETDLALTMQSSRTNSGTQVTFTLSNNQDMGAHDVTLSFDLADATNVVYDASDNISCSDGEGRANCTLQLLPGGGASSVVVSLPIVVSDEALNPVLSSKTHDANLLNNSLPESGSAVAGEEVTSLDGNNSEKQLAVRSGEGGGSLHWISAMSLLLFGLFRRRVAVLGSGR